MPREPEISQELIEYLEATCPDRSPSIDTPDRNIWFNAGQAGLVQHLRSLYERQTTTVTGEHT